MQLPRVDNSPSGQMEWDDSFQSGYGTHLPCLNGKGRVYSRLLSILQLCLSGLDGLGATLNLSYELIPLIVSSTGSLRWY